LFILGGHTKTSQWNMTDIEIGGKLVWAYIMA
jgi:hypothetical protein